MKKIFTDQEHKELGTLFSFIAVVLGIAAFVWNLVPDKWNDYRIILEGLFGIVIFGFLLLVSRIVWKK